MVLDNEKIKVRIGASRPLGLGTEEDHLLGVNLTDDTGRHFFDKLFDVRTHGLRLDILFSLVC
jgi:hypothetical protein